MAALCANDCEIPEKNSSIFDLAMAIVIMKAVGDIKN